MGSPMVSVPKPDNSVRICGDYKVTINPHLDVNQYPLPRSEELFAALNGEVHSRNLISRKRTCKLNWQRVNLELYLLVQGRSSNSGLSSLKSTSCSLNFT